jgi:hypothetical protein
VCENRPDLTRCAIEAAAAAEGVEILWGVPCCPEWNPIEMVWAQVKAYVGELYQAGRTFPELFKQLRDAMYTRMKPPGSLNNVRGGGFAPPGIPAAPAAPCLPALDIINSSWRNMDEWIRTKAPEATDPTGKVVGRWISGTVATGLTVFPDLEDAVKACPTRRVMLHWIRQRVAYDMKATITNDDIEEVAGHEAPAAALNVPEEEPEVLDLGDEEGGEMDVEGSGEE